MTDEFTPDWKLSQQDQLQVHLSIALAKHIPGWLGATDEQLAAVAGDLSPAIAKAIDDEREACIQIAVAAQDRCSDEMNKYFAEGQDAKAEAYRLRLEGAAWVVQKLDAAAIRSRETDNE
jgi:hypothetical protein